MLVINGKSESCWNIDPKDLLASSPLYKLYIARPHGMPSGTYLARIPNEYNGNGCMYAEARLLRRLMRRNAEVEKAWEESDGYNGKAIHYDWLIPELVDEFRSSKSLQGRRLNIYRFPDADLADFTPFMKLRKSITGIDAKTAAWILGRFLKFQAYLDSVAQLELSFDAGQVLIAPGIHRVVYLGFFEACKEGAKYSEYSSSTSRQNIMLMIAFIRDMIIKNSTEGEDDFIEIMNSIDGKYDNGLKAHGDYYAALGKLWESKYHPFTYMQGGVWKSAKTEFPKT